MSLSDTDEAHMIIGVTLRREASDGSLRVVTLEAHEYQVSDSWFGHAQFLPAPAAAPVTVHSCEPERTNIGRPGKSMVSSRELRNCL